MNKKTALTILAVVIIVAILLIGFFLFFQKQTEQKNPVIEAARNFFGGFFPAANTNEQSNQSNPQDQNNETTNGVIPRLRQISNFPVAGGVMFEKTSTTSSLLVQEAVGTSTATSTNNSSKTTVVVYRFVERSTGHVYETTSRDLSQQRITNTTIPKIYQAYFSGDGENLSMIYLNPSQAIETFLGKINYPKDATTTATSTYEIDKKSEENFANITGTFLPSESFGFTKSQTSNDFAFLKTSDSVNGGYIVNLYTGNLKTPLLNKNVYNLNTSEWEVQILKDGVLALNTKPSIVSEGFLYFLNPKEGILKKKLGNTLGLTSLVSPDGKKIFYSYYDSGDTKTVVYDSVKKTYTSLNISTIVGDKCVWSPKDNTIVYCAVPNNLIRGNFPDFWYQGKYEFNDDLVAINTNDFTVKNLMVANSETKKDLDVVNLQISPNEDYLLFMNKSDLILWSLDIK